MKFRVKPRTLTLFLCISLLTRALRVYAQEDTAQYRKEFYREDDDRMSVDTDTVFFDLGIGTQVRLQGQFVVDAISGATPTGAPPPDQWRYADYNYFFQRADTQLFQAEVYNTNNYILYTSGVFNSFADYTNYIENTYAQQIAQGASNNAAASLNGLTNKLLNPSYRSSSVPLTSIHDVRHAYSVTTPVTFGNNTLTPNLAYSTESDYRSVGYALNYDLQLNQKNTTLHAGVAYTPDEVRDYTQVNWQHKTSEDFLVGVTQLLTPKSYLTFDFTLGLEEGYLSDPYRQVMALYPDPQAAPGAILYPENRPRHRTKETAYISFTQFADPLDGSVELGYRFFHDTYGITASTFEATWHQNVIKNLVFSPGIRYYYQSAASFYNVIFLDANNFPTYYSSDYRLSNMETFTYSLNLNYRLVKHFSLDLDYKRYVMRGLDGITSQSAYPSANVYSVGGRFWF